MRSKKRKEYNHHVSRLNFDIYIYFFFKFINNIFPLLTLRDCSHDRLQGKYNELLLDSLRIAYINNVYIMYVYYNDFLIFNPIMTIVASSHDDCSR